MSKLPKDVSNKGKTIFQRDKVANKSYNCNKITQQEVILKSASSKYLKAPDFLGMSSNSNTFFLSVRNLLELSQMILRICKIISQKWFWDQFDNVENVLFSMRKKVLHFNVYNLNCNNTKSSTYSMYWLRYKHFF